MLPKKVAGYIFHFFLSLKMYPAHCCPFLGPFLAHFTFEE